MARTWEKKLADALPQACKDVIEGLIIDRCPYELFRDAPNYTAWNCEVRENICRKCWESCTDKCLLEVGESYAAD